MAFGRRAAAGLAADFLAAVVFFTAVAGLAAGFFAAFTGAPAGFAAGVGVPASFAAGVGVPAGFAAGVGVPASFAAGFPAAGFFTPAFLAVAAGFDAALAAFVLVPLAAFFGSGAGMVGGDYTKNFLNVPHPIRPRSGFSARLPASAQGAHLDRAGEATPPCPDCGRAHPPGERCGPDTIPVGTEAPSKTLLFGGDSLVAPPSPPASGPSVDPLVGTQVGSFRVVRLLGRGGMGTVYLAEHPAIGSKVAVKFLHESLAENPSVVARFYDEARAVNLIGHENIVAIYDLNLLPPNRYYFVMEYLDGETLHAAVRGQRLELPAAIDVLLQLCDALQCAHERGVVHRDLKPDNVFLVTRGGRHHFVKLVDFGIAKLRGGAGGDRTSAGLIVGTPEYMAPEQCDDGAIDARTDVYALGVMAYELLAGRLPFQGKTVTQLLLAHLQQAPPPLSRFVKGIDPELERAIMKALAKAPADRHGDMARFAEALRPVLARLEQPAAAPSPPRPTPSAAPAPAAVIAPAAPPPTPVRVELRAGDATRQLVAVEVTRGGLFLGAETDLPPLFSRVALTVSHPALRTRLELSGEVVRHVSAAEAARWHMAPGFAVQLVELTPERRAALTDLVEATRGAPATQAPAARSWAEQLKELEERPASTHYAFLGLPLDAEFAEIRRAARELRTLLEAIRSRPEAPDHHARATALLARLDVAQHALSVPAERLVYDSGRGNYLGVARCVAAGVPQAVIVGRRREYLARHADRERAAQGHLARSQVARKMKNRAAAIAAYEAALTADPLDLATLEAYVAYRREAS